MFSDIADSIVSKLRKPSSVSKSKIGLVPVLSPSCLLIAWKSSKISDPSRLSAPFTFIKASILLTIGANIWEGVLFVYTPSNLPSDTVLSLVFSVTLFDLDLR